MRREYRIRWVIGILLVVACLSAGYLGTYIFSLRQAAQEFGELALIFQGDSRVEEEREKEIKPGYARLRAQNKDLIGWLTIPGTAIDYPVMYTPEAPEYYLHRDFAGGPALSGMLFIDGQCTMQPRSDNLIIHGHNMKNGSMFGALLRYAEKDFWERHSQLDFCFFGAPETYTVLAAFRTEVYNEALTFKAYDFIRAENKSAFDAFIMEAKKAALYETGVTASYGDYLLTLSTCAYHTPHGRFVVLARKDDKEKNVTGSDPIP